MIVIGYQGIGKSTLAKDNLKYIDLESSCFRVNGVRTENWYEMYCNVAEDLSRQGYTVFTSSHAVIRSRLKYSTENVFVCCPALNLKGAWIKRLRDRYDQTGLDKDYRALMNAEDQFDENIMDIMNSGFPIIKIEEMKYSLEDLIEDAALYLE